MRRRSWRCWSGVPEATAATWFGNSAEMIRKVYAHWTDETRADAAARSALDFVGAAPAATTPGPKAGKVIDMSEMRKKRRSASAST